MVAATLFSPLQTVLSKLSKLSTQRFARNLFSSVYGQIVAISVQFLPIPIVIAHWGVERYATWLVIASLQVFIGIVDSGLFVGFQRRLIQSAKGASAEARDQAANEAVIVQFGLGIVCLTVIGAVALFLDIPAILGIQAQNGGKASALFVWMGINTIVGIFSSAALTPLRVAEKFAKVALIQHSYRLLEVFTTCAFVLSGFDEIRTAQAGLVVRLLLFAVAIGYLSRVGFRPATLMKTAKKMDLQPIREGMATILQPLYLAISIQGILQSVNYSLGAAAAASFSIMRAISRIPLQATIPVLAPILIEYTVADAEKDEVAMKRMRFKTELYTIGVTVLGGVVVYFMAGHIVHFLGKSQIPFDAVALLLLLVAGALSAQSLGYGQMLIARGRFHRFGIAGVVTGIATLAAVRMMGGSIGLRGVCVACIAFEFVLVVLARRACGSSSRQ